jgi:mannose-6-phosphate isomerase-like protein (cupin superfamily)
MYKYSVSNVEPIVSEHGEIIYELVGPNLGETTQRHSVAHVVIPPGKSSLLHYHPEAEESYHVLKGNAQIILGEEQEALTAGETILIPSPKPHKIINTGKEDLEFIAVCVPAWEPTNSIFLE